MNDLFSFLKDHLGKLSGRRIGGIACLVQGLFMKLILFSYGIIRVTKTDFDKLDYCCDSLIYTGAALLGASVAEIILKKK